MIRVLIVADSTERADAMAALLEEDQRFEVSDMQMADVILCLGIPLRRIPRRSIPVVAISQEPDTDAPFDDTLKAWLPINSTLEQIGSALTAAAGGFTVLTRPQARRTFRAIPSVDENSPAEEQLTVRELQVLQMMAGGYANKDIGVRLNISPNTAKFHVAQILAKLGASSRTEAVSSAIRRGLVPI